MAVISRREIQLMGSRNEDINRFVDEIKTFLEEKKIPNGYTINVYKVRVPSGAAVEIEGPEDQSIEDLDLMIYSKIIEICERRNIEYHKCEPLEVLKLGR